MDLNIAIDFGASGSKVIYGQGKNAQGHYLIEPSFRELPARLENTLPPDPFAGNPVNRMIVRTKRNGDLFLLGKIAQQMKAQIDIECPKYEEAIYKTLGIVGLICSRFNVEQANLSLLCLLPFDEFRSQDNLKKGLERHLKEFYFQDQCLQVELKHFRCVPEGGGLLLHEKPKQGNSAVVMFGQRNTSILVTSNGSFDASACATAKYGFFDFCTQLAERSSNLSPERVFKALAPSAAPAEGKKSSIGCTYQVVIDRLVSAKRPDNRKSEIRTMETVYRQVKSLYWMQLSEWFDRQLPEPLDKVTVAGGATTLFEEELLDYFSKKNVATVDSARSLRTQLGKVLALETDPLAALRFADVSAAYWNFVKADPQLLKA